MRLFVRNLRVALVRRRDRNASASSSPDCSADIIFDTYKSIKELNDLISCDQILGKLKKDMYRKGPNGTLVNGDRFEKLLSALIRKNGLTGFDELPFLYYEGYSVNGDTIPEVIKNFCAKQGNTNANCTAATQLHKAHRLHYSSRRRRNALHKLHKATRNTDFFTLSLSNVCFFIFGFIAYGLYKHFTKSKFTNVAKPSKYGEMHLMRNVGIVGAQYVDTCNK